MFFITLELKTRLLSHTKSGTKRRILFKLLDLLESIVVKFDLLLGFF